MDLNIDKNADNSNAISDQSEIDKLLASLSGDINPSEFDAMSNNDDSSDLFDEVGFDENEQTLDDIIDEDLPIEETSGVTDVSSMVELADSLEASSLVDMADSAGISSTVDIDDSTNISNLVYGSTSANIDNLAGTSSVEDFSESMTNSELFDDYSATSNSDFEQMPSFSRTNMLLDNASIISDEGMFEEAYQNDDIAVEDDAYEEDAPYQNYSTNQDQCNVITKGTIINGGMISDCSLSVMGTINGDIECNGKLSIFGNVTGNSVASDIYLNTRKLVGNLDSTGCVKVALGTIVIGNVKSKSAVIAGAVKGDLDVNGPVILDSTAIIKGNITAKSVQMNNGAVLEGNCSFSYADINIDQIFEN